MNDQLTIQDSKYINAMCCCFNLRKSARAVTQLFDRCLEPAGVRATQFTLLLTLTSVEGKTLTEMADNLVMDRTTLTRNLKPLEKATLIHMIAMPDKRTKGYVLTDKGLAALERAIPLWQKAQTELVVKLGNAEYQSLLKDLALVCNFATIGKSGYVKVIQQAS